MEVSLVLLYFCLGCIIKLASDLKEFCSRKEERWIKHITRTHTNYATAKQPNRIGNLRQAKEQPKELNSTKCSPYSSGIRINWWSSHRTYSIQNMIHIFQNTHRVSSFHSKRMLSRYMLTSIKYLRIAFLSKKDIGKEHSLFKECVWLDSSKCLSNEAFFGNFPLNNFSTITVNQTIFSRALFWKQRISFWSLRNIVVLIYVSGYISRDPL